MTTFGGSTIPPLFGGAGGDAIFIRDVGAPHLQTSNISFPATLLDLPTRQAGDLLVAVATQYSGNLAPSGATAFEWTSDTIGGGGSTLSTRIATNDALDDYLVPAVADFQLSVQFFCQMICLASKDPAKTVDLFQDGIESSFNTGLLPLDAIAVGTEANDTFVLGEYLHWYSQAFSTLMPTSMNDPANINLIGKIISGISRTDTPASTFQYFVSGWGGIYQATSAAFATQNIPYTTAFGGGTAQVRSRYHRFRLI